MTLKVLLAIRNKECRQKIANHIDWVKMDLELVASIDNGESAKIVLTTLKPDIVITELNLKGIYPFLEECPIYHTLVYIEEDKGEIEKAFEFGIYKLGNSPITREEVYNQLCSIIELIKKDRIKYNVLSDNEIIQTLELKTYSSDLIVLSAISFIKQNYKRSIGLQEAASLIKVSEAHLSRIFKAETGLNYVRYLNIYRLNAAIELMSREEMTINQIGTVCGFNTMSYFAKIFKRELGIIPSKYRKLYVLYS
ncbi:MAG: DNA-binding response regulator [Spirochaetaceae bacterium]|nr:DNA-binding response regulator [Spirochaetaceae bacterium]